MAEIWSPLKVSNLNNLTSMAQNIDSNFSTAAGLFNDVLSRSGNAPNQMQSVLDMNSNRIINVGAPQSTTDVARIMDIPPVSGGGPTTINNITNNTTTVGVNILNYGGKGDGVTNNVSALAAAFAALPANGGTIYFPAGVYLFSTLVQMTMPNNQLFNVRLLGDGQDNTILYWPTTSGIQINYNNGASFTGSATGTVLTVTSVASGTILVGAAVTDNTTNFNTFIIGQTSGSTGGAGTYTLLAAPGSSTGSESMVSGSIVNPHSCEVSDLTFATGGSGLGFGLVLNQLHYNTGNLCETSIIQNCAFHLQTNFLIEGLGAGSNYWLQALQINNVSQVNVVNCTFTGTSVPNVGYAVTINFSSGSATQIPAVFNFIGNSFYGWNGGIYCGSWFQGLTCTACNFDACTYGIYVSPGASLLAQLAVTNCQFGLYTYTVTGTVFPEYALQLNSPVASVLFTNNVLTFVPAASMTAPMIGINAVQLSNSVIANNTFQSPTPVLYNVQGVAAGTSVGSTSAQIVDNVFIGMATAISIASTAHGIYMENSYQVCTNTVVAATTTDTTLVGPDIQQVPGSKGVYSATANIGMVGETLHATFFTVNLNTSAQTTSGATLSFSNTSQLLVGYAVTGTNIPANSWIISIVPNTSITMNNNVSGTVANGATITFNTQYQVTSAAWQNNGSITLTAGDWDVWGQVTFYSSVLATSNILYLQSNISATAGSSIPYQSNNSLFRSHGFASASAIFANGAQWSQEFSAYPIQTASNLTLFLNTNASFSGTTPNVQIFTWDVYARRRR